MTNTAPQIVSSFVSRRRFVQVGAAGVWGWLCGRPSRRKITLPAAPKLAAYDELLTAFLREHKAPGAALAVAYRGRLVYARGFGLADVEEQKPVVPDSLFRIASVSKPFTAAAVMRLVEQGKLSLEDRVAGILKIEPHLERGARMDPRWGEIRVRHCLQHTGGWDRGKSFDPMSAQTAEEVARSLKMPLPIDPTAILRYTMGKPLDFAPGTGYAYSNFGYCVLGRVIEAVARKPYHEFVAQSILAPLGIRRMQLGKNLSEDRARGEVRYYDSGRRTGRAISGPRIGHETPLPYGVECLETMDANGGWIASAVDLLRFAAALDDPKRCPVLKQQSVCTMLAPPPEPLARRKGMPKNAYYACGWFVRPGRQSGTYTKWHTGLLAGTSTLLVCRDDGVDWAVLFNSDADPNGKNLANQIDPLLHKPADQIKDWPEVDLFSHFS